MTSNRLRVGPGEAVGVTESMIAEVVNAFYARIRSDDSLGPIFERVIGENWDHHLSKMRDFWSSVLLMSGRFHGTPMAAHIKLGDLEPHHFKIWLDLFEKTVTEICPLEAAALFVMKANMIAQSLQLGIAHHRGDPLVGRPESRATVADDPPITLPETPAGRPYP
ncbi:group III truncated hemoglobin [Hyphomicrobium sp. DY-1]|uniref:group III truncated hemoglobin n=1 Tax=Hyphomicrobium sp. DY-1 TaxID=3075650 RepID=UPI0039C2E1AC